MHAPLTYLDKDGSQRSIDPSGLSFEGAELVVDPVKIPIGEFDWMENWLKFLARTGVVVAAPPDTQPARPAMVLQARNPGSAGNDIEIEITYADPPNTFTLKATQTDVYEGLTLETLPVLLGTELKAGTRPGLVRVKGTPVAMPKARPGKLVGADANSRGSLDVAGTTGTAFTLEARDTGAETIDVEIDEVTERTFTLTAKWTKSVSGLQASNLEKELAKFGHVLTASKPTGGFALPRAGTFQLNGGKDSTFASFVPAAQPT
ncbi:hypothetical protein [Archangium lansingense]|uniref:Uncharacterized protein n=1 Tax=Archangium lansingense TaxID=2995310 RepID=A0ABT4ABT4_9BACT|nr:hypothetical protein [Archangium lansinium]MCY1078694.1 hypothetical protein [Archangium lansinium]